eukprot:3842869-Pyramimonas_sp.AAC.1
MLSSLETSLVMAIRFATSSSGGENISSGSSRCPAAGHRNGPTGARVQLESQRELLHDRKPLPTKLNAMSRRVEAARAARVKAALDLSSAQDVLREATEARRCAWPNSRLKPRRRTTPTWGSELQRLAASPPEGPAARKHHEANIDSSAVVELLGTIEG